MTSDREHANRFSAQWILPFDGSVGRGRLTNLISTSAGQRFIEYTDYDQWHLPTRRINLWQYVPAQSEQPYLYFDTSRHPAATAHPTSIRRRPRESQDALRLSPRDQAAARIGIGQRLPIQFCNPDKFQILHAGVDDAVGRFERDLDHDVGQQSAGLFLSRWPLHRRGGRYDRELFREARSRRRNRDESQESRVESRESESQVAVSALML